jgi:DNA helicase-2/ATP-dependent DNA helicase PcrA
MYYFESYINLFKWLSNKIVKENEKGSNFSDMVIMARTNILLENAEIHLFNNNIKYTKHLGTLLLNKSHVKDFIAFIIVSYNSKSTVHWIRILCLNNNYNISEASKIINSSKNILKKLKDIAECKNLIELYNNINKVSENEKIKLILNYFKQNLNFSKNDLNDIEKLIKYFSNLQDLNDFINNVYLNHETKNENSDSLYLTTIHGAKGLEWNTVFLIDSINKHEKNEIEEERRLLYVATSRAKIKLNILCLTNKSHLLNDIDKKLYKTIMK